MVSDEHRDASSNVSLLSSEPPEAAAGLRSFCSIVKYDDPVLRGRPLLITQIVNGD